MIKIANMEREQVFRVIFQDPELQRAMRQLETNLEIPSAAVGIRWNNIGPPVFPNGLSTWQPALRGRTPESKLVIGFGPYSNKQLLWLSRGEIRSGMSGTVEVNIPFHRDRLPARAIQGCVLFGKGQFWLGRRVRVFTRGRAALSPDQVRQIVAHFSEAGWLAEVQDGQASCQVICICAIGQGLMDRLADFENRMHGLRERFSITQSFGRTHDI